MSLVFTPVNQSRFTNIAVVKLKIDNKRFEIACYKNKVVTWRQGLETEIDEVLQTPAIFQNISKGELANRADILHAFGNLSDVEICKTILEKGELQVSDKERQKLIDTLTKEIIGLVVDKTINPETKRPYPMKVIERFIDKINFSVNTNKKPKQQALELIKILNNLMPIQRVRMRVKIKLPVYDSIHFDTLIQDIDCTVESQTEDDFEMKEYICLLDPGKYRDIDKLLLSLTGNKDALQIVNLKVTNENEEIIS